MEMHENRWELTPFDDRLWNTSLMGTSENMICMNIGTSWKFIAVADSEAGFQLISRTWAVVSAAELHFSSPI